MSPVHAIQPTFSGGEFAPSLYSRVDLQKYGTGARRVRNFYIHPHGGASNRPGFIYVAAAKYANKKCRLLEFEFSVTQAYVLEFGEYYLRIHTNGGTLMSGGVPYELVTPYSEADLALLKITQSADVLYIVHPDHPPKTLERYADSPPDWQLNDFTFKNGPFMTSNLKDTHTLTASAFSGVGITVTSSLDLFAPEHAESPGALFRMKHAIAGQAVHHEKASGTSGASSAIRCGGTWRVISHGSWAGAFTIERSDDGSTNWTMLRKFTSNWTSAGEGDFNVNTFGTDDGQFWIRINVESNITNGTLIVDLSSDPYEHTGIFQVTGYTNAKTVTAKVLTQLGGTSATYDWAEGSWSHAAGFPSSIVFYQDRLCPASTYQEPQTIWMSKTGIYDDFGRSQPLEDTDGISVPLPSRKMNGIENLVALGEIIPLTAGSEWAVGAPQGASLTPTSIDARVQGYRGSSKVAPVLVGNRVVYIQPMGSVVRDLGYSYDVNGYKGDDLSVFANHLFSNYSITEMAYQQEPDSLVWCVRSDGKLLCLTYLLEHEVVAWSWHDTDGEVESVATIPSDGINELWVVVKRGSSRFIERMAKRDTSDVKKQFFVDCGLTYDSPLSITGITKANPAVVTSAAHGLSNGDFVDFSEVLGMTEVNGKRYKIAGVTANTFSLQDADTGANVDSSAFTTYVSGGEARKAVDVVAGLGHLEGKTVSILADGNVIPATVVTTGQVTLPIRAGIIHVGLPYICDLQTLNVELKLDDGTTQDRFVKIPEVTIRFLNSRGGWVGPDESHLDEIIQRTNESLGSPIALQSTDYIHTLSSTYERGGSVFFRQIDPLPVTILAIMPKVTHGG